MRHAMRLCGLAALALMAISPARGDETPVPGAWSLQVTPYIWASGLDAKIRPAARVPTLHVSESFGDVLEDLDIGFFLNSIAVRDRMVLMGDLSYVASSREGSFDGTPFAGRGEVTQLTLGAAAGYRVVQESRFTLDIMAGLRAWQVDAKANVTAAGAPFASAASDLGWVDPLLVFRARAILSPRWSMLVIGDVGGFGVGSEGTAQATAVVNWQVSDHAFVSAGYRWITADYKDGARRLDLTLAGPVLGLTWRF